MGRLYWFECARCGYRARVSGRADRGVNLFVQTIVCQDCKELYDVVTRMKLPADLAMNLNVNLDVWRSGMAELWPSAKGPPSFQSAVNRLTVAGRGSKFTWAQFQPRCPVFSFHRVRPWNDPDRCPRCGIYLDKNTLPYRIWD